jgi:peptidoglycan glycosyltransferase
VVGYADPRFGASGIEGSANIELNGGKPGTLREWGELGRQLITQAKRPRATMSP